MAEKESWTAAAAVLVMLFVALSFAALSDECSVALGALLLFPLPLQALNPVDRVAVRARAAMIWMLRILMVDAVLNMSWSGGAAQTT